MRFDGKVALVTGAGSGIGLEVALALASEGARVGVLDVDAEAANRAARRIFHSGGRATALVADVTDVEAVAAATDALVAVFGGIDLLASMAGIMRTGTTEAGDVTDWTAVLATNLTAPYLVTRQVLPHLRRRGGGAIVYAASILAYTSGSTLAAYSASKAGLIALAKSVALEHAAAGIRVNCVAPGTVRTPMLERAAGTAGASEPVLQEMAQANPIGRLIMPAEVAHLTLFLLSDEARAITGSSHLIDGGLLARTP